MKEKWGFTKGWTRNPQIDEPEIVYFNGIKFPQFVGFKDKKGSPHLISRIIAIAQGLIGLKEVKDWSVSSEEYIRLKNK